jgi:N-acetylneuraminic acid mutarotase
MKHKYLILKLFILLFVLIGAGWICTAFSQGGWEQLEDMPTARGGPGCCIVDGKIYVIGGWGALGGTGISFASNEVYDTALNEWTVRANAKEELQGTINGVNDKVYAIGNYAENTVEEYDPAQDDWTFKNNMPENRWMHASCVYNDTIYVFGGVTDNRFSARIYDPNSDTWGSIPDMPHNRSLASCCVCNNKIYVFGGVTFFASCIIKSDVYDPAKKNWETIADLPKSSYGHVAIVHENKIILFGGDNGPSEISPKKYVYKYDPDSDKWTKMKDMPFNRSMMAGVKVGKYVYLFGGFEQPTMESMSSEAWKFNLDSLKEYQEPTLIKQPYLDEQNSFVIHQNYPNPFSGFTLIRYELAEPGKVQLEIINILGEKIITLVNEAQYPGSYKVTWNAEGVHPGIYFCKLKVADSEKVSKLVVSY